MRAAALAADDRIYVYGVARPPSGRALPLAACEGIVPGRPVELVPFRGLAAIVSAFPAEAPAQEAGLNEGARARSRAEAHRRVLAELANRMPLAPSKFGTVLLSLDSLAAFIERNAATLEETLDRVAGCGEWGLKLSGDPSIARTAAGSAPSLAPLREELASAPDGKAYFVRKKLKLAVEAQAQRMLTARAIEVHQRLDALARRSVHIRSYRSLSAAGANGPCMLLNAAYLVEAAGEARFHRALDAIRGSFAAFGLSVALSGPWPPFSFVSALETAEALPRTSRTASRPTAKAAARSWIASLGSQ